MVNKESVNLKEEVVRHICSSNKLFFIDTSISDETLAVILLQFEALGLLLMIPGEGTKLSPKGRAYLSKLLVVRKPSADAAEPHTALEDKS